jgi:hypothetical protein
VAFTSWAKEKENPLRGRFSEQSSATHFGGRQRHSPGAVAGYFFARFKV